MSIFAAPRIFRAPLSENKAIIVSESLIEVFAKILHPCEGHFAGIPPAKETF